MKQLGLLLMILNHLIAPFIHPLAVLWSGELTRHLLVFGFMDDRRFRPIGYRQHVLKYSILLACVVFWVLLMQLYFGVVFLIQMPLVWLVLMWSRPLVFANKRNSFILGTSLWVGLLAIYLSKLGSEYYPYCLSGLNLTAASLCFPFLHQFAKKLSHLSIALIVVYPILSITAALLGPGGSQFDSALVGLPITLAVLANLAWIDRVKSPRVLTKFSLSFYTGTLIISTWIHMRYA